MEPAPHHARPSWGGRLTGIEGLRALAATSVLAGHAIIHAPNRPDLGAFDRWVVPSLTDGLVLFFTLSGFLLFRPFASAVLRGAPFPSPVAFLRNRALRILPAYWAVLLAVTLLFQRELLERPLQLLANMTFLQSYVPRYIPGPFHGLGIAAAWSLCVEVVFYLVLPVLGLLALVLADADVLDPVLACWAPVALMAVVGTTSLLSARAFRLGAVWRMSFLTHAHWFAVGMAISIVRTLWEDGRVRLPRWWRPAAVLTAVVLAVAALKLQYGGSLTFDEAQSLLAVACGVVLALVVLPPRGRSPLLAVLEWRPVVALGLISYSLFLWHEPILRAVRDAGLTAGGQAGFALDLALVAALAIGASTLTYLLVEKPALALKRPAPRALPEERTAEISAAP
jgi:peptidoglycan/LPS O-acetylase OafA/YrhL